MSPFIRSGPRAIACARGAPAPLDSPAMSAPTPAGFDAAADRFDADELGNRVIAHTRRRIQRQFEAAFAPAARLLEIGAGTGTEAARLVSERGCRIALTDVSPRLLERAAAKVAATRNDAVIGVHRMPARAVHDLTAVYGFASFDGAYSSHGPLNCEASLDPVARGLAALVRPGGALVLSVINRWCPVEVAWFAWHRQWREAARRWRGPVLATAYPGGAKDVMTWYYSRSDIERAFSADFRVEYVEALPLLWPPTYLDFLVTRFEATFRALEPVELWAARQPVLRGLGDHVLMRLRRL
jgi:SAM-dependent methyltransferase